MKKNIGVACIVTFLLVGSFSVIVAGPVSSSNLGREYVISDSDLRSWSFGLYANSSERGLKPVGSAKLERTMGYIGYDFVPWLTTYVTAGLGKASINPASGDNQFNYGLGAHLNLIDKEILDPTLYEDRVRVTAGLQYIAATAKYINTDTRFDEFSGSLILTLINDLEGNKDFIPNSLGLFGGLLYSTFVTDKENLKADGNVGFTVGFEIYYTESVALYIATEKIDKSGYTAGVNVRF
jgi:hypothetical protein